MKTHEQTETYERNKEGRQQKLTLINHLITDAG